MADFIDDGPQGAEDDWAPGGTEAPPSSQPSAATQARFDPLSNLILLSGPTSSGKTCTVYAAAKELGYAIFEVSPNQPRGHKELLSAIGEVGRNHLVWNTQGKGGNEAQKKKGGVMDFFSKAKAKAAKNDTAGASSMTPQTPTPTTTPSSPTKNPTSVQQSLILLEEVDILFQADKSHASFWDGKPARMGPLQPGADPPCRLCRRDTDRVQITPPRRHDMQWSVFRGYAEQGKLVAEYGHTLQTLLMCRLIDWHYKPRWHSKGLRRKRFNPISRLWLIYKGTNCTLNWRRTSTRLDRHARPYLRRRPLPDLLYLLHDLHPLLGTCDTLCSNYNSFAA